MTQWIKLALPAAALAVATTPVHAVRFMTVEQSQRLSFPSATHFEEIGPLVWNVRDEGQTKGKYVIDHVIGKHLYIDYAVALTPSGGVHAVEILQYRESYGGEIRSPSWLAQFVGKTSGSSLKINGDIRNIAGATLSSTHITEGVKRVLAAYGNRLR